MAAYKTLGYLYSVFGKNICKGEKKGRNPRCDCDWGKRESLNWKRIKTPKSYKGNKSSERKKEKKVQKEKMEIKAQIEKGNNDILLPKLFWSTAKGQNNFFYLNAF